jgi:hypothetical protein
VDVCFNNIIDGGIEKVRSDAFQGEQRHSGAKKPGPRRVASKKSEKLSRVTPARGGRTAPFFLHTAFV